MGGARVGPEFVMFDTEKSALGKNKFLNNPYPTEIFALENIMQRYRKGQSKRTEVCFKLMQAVSRYNTGRSQVWTEIYDDLHTLLVNPPHVGDLFAPLNVVLLINTECIDPDKA